MRSGLAANGAGRAPAELEGRPAPEAEAPTSALTARALALGSLIGAAMCLCNLYVGLKTGLAFSVALIACIGGLGAHRALATGRPSRSARPGLSLVETSAMQSVASSAGYSTGATLISAGVGWLLLAGHHPPGWALLLWTLLVSALGVLFAVPLQRAFLRTDPLPFPTGLAIASAARSLRAGDEGGRRGTRALGLASLGAGLMALVRDGLKLFPTSLALPGTVRGVPLASLSFALELNPLALGVGALVGLQVGASLLLGSVACFGVLVPWLHARGLVAGQDFSSALDWTMWPGTALVTSASFTHLLLQPGVLRRAFGALLHADATAAVEPSGLDVPRSWFLAGVVALSSGIVALGAWVFGIPAYVGLFGVLLSFPLAVVACRVNGETDVAPSGPLGQVAQLAFGALLPGNTLANAMAASLSGSTASASADLLTDVKAGLLLGARPRQIFLAQLLGCAIGSAVIVPAFLFLVPDTSAISPERFPAPAGLFIAGVARVLAAGFGALSGAARWGALAGAIAGVVLALVERHAPSPLRRFVPSSIAVGLAFVLPASLTLSMFLGALASALLARARPAFAAATVPLAAGLIAGDSLVSLFLSLLAARG